MSRRASIDLVQGPAPSTRLGASVEFGDLRRYNRGDDYRYVDWNAYARLDELFLKLFHEEGDICLFILVDASASMGFGSPTKFVCALRLAAALSYVALAGMNRSSVMLLKRGGCEGLRPVKGRKQIFRVFEFLESARPEGPTRLAGALEAFAAEAPHAGRVVLISDLMDESDAMRGLRRLNYLRFETQVVHILSPQEERPGIMEGALLRDSETDEDVPAAPADCYERERAAFVGSMRERCSKAGIPYLETTTDTDLEELLFGPLTAGAGRI